MYRGGFRTGWIAGAAVFGAVCGIGTQALASGSYSVHLAVPRTVVTGHEFRVTAAGAASQKAHLTVFLAAHKCKASAKAEATAGVKIIAKTVVHSYSSSQTEKASAPGKQYACAYLSSTTFTDAHASKAFTVVAPKPPHVTLVVTPGTVQCSAVSFNVAASDSVNLTDVHVDLGYGYVSDYTNEGTSFQELFQEGYPSDASGTASVTATDAHGLMTTVSKPFTAPACP